MKKQLLRFVSFNFAMVSTVVIAQPVLTATGVNPVIGDVEAYTSSSYIVPGPGGAGQTWNFASVTGTAGAPVTFVSVASTSHAGSFPDANLAMDQGGGAYSFQKASSTAYQSYGSVAGTGGTVVVYSDPEDLMHYPFTFNDTYSDSWATTFSNGGYTFFRKGNSTATADAYGTLTTPMGTFTNATRVHFVQAYRDSAFVGVPYVITNNNDQYFWYVDGTHDVLAYTFTFTSSESGTPTTGSGYLSSTTASISDNNEYVSSANLYPNPAADKIAMDVNLTENKAIAVTLYNAVGQQIETGFISGMQGSNTLTFDISSFPKGIYYAQIKVEGQVAGTKQFIVSK